MTIFDLSGRMPTVTGGNVGIGPGIAAAPADARATVVTAVDGGYSSRG